MNHRPNGARDFVPDGVPGIEKLARWGYAAKGVVYLLVGGLAVFAAAGSGGRTTDSGGALSTFAGSTLGRAALVVIAIGLASYAIWMAVRAIKNPEHDDGGKRALHGLVALIYASLTVEAALLAWDGEGGAGGSGGNDDAASHWSARLMEQPFGPWLLGAVGVGIGLYGLQQLVNAWRVKLDEQLDLGALSPTGRDWVVRIGRFGLAARGLVFTIIGWFVVQAALESQPSEARGIGGVLDTLEQTPWLLAVIAAGLVAYGIYNLVRARYRAIRT